MTNFYLLKPRLPLCHVYFFLISTIILGLPYDNIIKICSISNNQVGPFPRPPFAPQIQSNRQWHQRMDTLPIHQNLNSNIASERFANALPPNHPFLQVSLNHMKTFA